MVMSRWTQLTIRRANRRALRGITFDGGVTVLPPVHPRLEQPDPAEAAEMIHVVGIVIRRDVAERLKAYRRRQAHRPSVREALWPRSASSSALPGRSRCRSRSVRPCCSRRLPPVAPSLRVFIAQLCQEVDEAPTGCQDWVVSGVRRPRHDLGELLHHRRPWKLGERHSCNQCEHYVLKVR